MVWNHKWFYEEIQSNMFPGGLIPVFLPDHEEPIHSYVDVDAYDNLLQLKEKEIIGPLATVGVYYFGDETKFIKAHDEQINANDKVNDEFYLAPVYNYLKENVGVFRVEKMLGMGTPQELNALKNSEWWDKLDTL